MKLRLFTFLVIAILTLSTDWELALAKGGADDPVGDDRGSSSSSSSNSEGQDDSGIRRESENEAERQERTFGIMGTIDSISGNQIVVLGETITIDPLQIANFQEGELEVGELLEIEGIVDESGNMIARDIEPAQDSDNSSNLAEDKPGENPLSEIADFFENLMSSIANAFK